LIILHFMDFKEYKPKTFWQRPEGITGLVVLSALVLGGGLLITSFLPTILWAMGQTVYLAGMLAVLGGVIYMALDPKMRNLVWYMYKSVMRQITGFFVQIDPIGILKSYVADLENNIRNMNRQIAKLRGQMHKLKESIIQNKQGIKDNLDLASKAKSSNQQQMVILKSRKAGRLKESNMKLEDLYKKMEILYRVLTKMYQNSEILAEDVKDQVKVKEQERKAIMASHSAMRTAMNVINGDADKKQMFDMALEAIADDVAGKVGEMERFMDMSSNFMDSIDLQNGVFEEEGLRMLEEWENKGVSVILGDEKADLLLQAEDEADVLDLNSPIAKPQRAQNSQNQYDSFFD